MEFLKMLIFTTAVLNIMYKLIYLKIAF